MNSMGEQESDEVHSAELSVMDMQEVVRDLHSYLYWRKRSGCRVLPPADRSALSGSTRIQPKKNQPHGIDSDFAHGAPQTPVCPKPERGSGAATSGLISLEMLRDELGECTRCKLSEGRKNLVFGVGNPNADLLFVGEAPGFEEDQQGEPFVGAAGKLLDRMIAAMGFGRKDVYICNVVKCRPPDNRFPEEDEIEACLPFVRAQIQRVAPKVIVGLGRLALQSLLGNRAASITKERGIWTEFEQIAFMPTFHPSFLLRNSGQKANVWKDLQAVMAFLEQKRV